MAQPLLHIDTLQLNIQKFHCFIW